MMWILLILVLIIIVFFIKMKKSRKKILLIIGIIFIVCLLVFLTYYFKNIYINPNWIMEIERADIDGFSNKVYIYSNYDVVIEYYPSKLYRKTKVKLDENIDLEKVYDYINNYVGEMNTNYKILLNSDSHKENRIVFISSEDEEIKDFTEKLNCYMEQIK